MIPMTSPDGFISAHPTNSKKQPLDQSTRKALIYIGRRPDGCGLRAVLNRAERREEWPGESTMWPGVSRQPDCRSPQTYSAFRACSRGLAGAHKKKSQPMRVGIW